MAGFLSALKRIYLTVYNWTVFVGWVQVLYFAVKTLREASYREVYDAVEKPLLLAQTAAVMEILHGLVGLVRSPVSATLPQISSRLYVIWGILWSFPEVRTHFLVSSLVISWSITEIIRYSFFGTKEGLGFAPSWFLWLRYSTFLILYPTGITSEVGMIYLALPYIRASDKYCIKMPNKWNFSFDYFYAAILALGIYVPGQLGVQTKGGLLNLSAINNVEVQSNRAAAVNGGIGTEDFDDTRVTEAHHNSNMLGVQFAEAGDGTAGDSAAGVGAAGDGGLIVSEEIM